jgi:predicted permease
MLEAFRALRRDPGLSLIAIVTFASAIGASIVAFAAVNALFLRPFSIREPERLFVLWEEDLGQDRHLVEVSFTNFLDWRARSTAFESMAAVGFHDWSFVLLGGDEPRRISYRAVAASFFETLGAEPLFGRGFAPADDEPGAERVLVLSHSLWQRLFDGDPLAIGKTLTFETGARKELFQVVGVMPAEFRFPAGAEAWAPAGREMAEIQGAQGLSDETVRWIGVFNVVARLRPGVPRERAEAEMDAIAGDLAATVGRKHGAVFTPFAEFLFGRTRIAVLAFFAAVALVVLIACANVSNLLAVRVVAKRRSFAIRRSLGASRGDIARTVVAESVLLALGGTALGLLVAPSALDVASALAPSSIPQLSDISLDASVALFAAALGLGAGMLASILPLLAVEGRTRFQNRGGLVVLQTALAVLVLSGAGLAGKSFYRLTRTDLGFDPKNAVSFDVSPSHIRYATDQSRKSFYRDLLDRLEEGPEIDAAGAVLVTPYRLGAIGQDAFVLAEGQSPAESERNPVVNWQVATPGYFRAMGTRLLKGRPFEPADDERKGPVAVVSENLARRMWPNGDAIGSRLSTLGLSRLGDPEPPLATVVGIVEDVRYRELDRARPNLYLSYLQVDPVPGHLNYVVRSRAEPGRLTGILAAALHSLDPEEPLEGIASMEEVVREAQAPWRFATVLLSSYAVLAAALAALGIFSVVSRSVSERRRELGVRIAVGARVDQILRMVLGRALRWTLAGAAIGLAAAWQASGLLASLLFDVKPADPAVFSATALLVLAIGIAAALVPARRAASTDPSEALRSE